MKQQLIITWNEYMQHYNTTQGIAPLLEAVRSKDYVKIINLAKEHIYTSVVVDGLQVRNGQIIDEYDNNAIVSTEVVKSICNDIKEELEERKATTIRIMINTDDLVTVLVNDGAHSILKINENTIFEIKKIVKRVHEVTSGNVVLQ